MFITILFAILMGGLYYGQTPSNAAGIQSRISVIAMLILLLGNYNLNTTIPFRFSDRALFYREYASGMYSSVMYGMSVQFVEDPYLVLEVICSVVIFYFMVGLMTDVGLFFFYLFLAFIYVECMTFIGGFFAAVFPSAPGAIIIATLFSQISSLFAGATVPGQNIPKWMLGLYYFVPMRWAQEGLITTQFEFDYTPVCIPNGNPTLYDSGSVPATCPGSFLIPGAIVNKLTNATTYACCPAGACPMTARDYVLYGLDNPLVCPTVIPSFLGGTDGYSYTWRWWDVLYVSFFLVLMRSLTVVVISHLSFQKR